MQPLIITHTVDWSGRPLSIVHNLPGLDAEFKPEQLEALARQLVRAARDAQSGARGVREYPECEPTVIRHPATPGFLEYATPEDAP